MKEAAASTTIDAAAAEFFVSVDGNPSGTGSRERPWDLKTALGKNKVVRAGDTIWLLGGIHPGGITCTLNGTKDRPIRVCGYPGQRATIDCAVEPGLKEPFNTVRVEGDYLVLRDFEVTCSNPNRTSRFRGSHPVDQRRGGLDVRGSHVSLINLVIHDVGVGVGHWASSQGGMVYGCIIYNCGWSAKDRGHGHAIYAQNEKGVRTIADNIVFHQFGNGINCYGSEEAHLNNFVVEGNLVFNNGVLERTELRTPGIMVGGSCGVKNIAIRDNLLLSDKCTVVLQTGWPEGPLSTKVRVQGNSVYGQFRCLNASDLIFEDNVFYSDRGFAHVDNTDAIAWDNNQYNSPLDGKPILFHRDGDSQGGHFRFTDWQGEGFDANSEFTNSWPSEAVVFVRPNQYEKGRANIGILNFGERPSVEVDLSHVLTVGQSFYIVSVFDFFGAPIVEGVYRGGDVRLPVDSLPAAQAVGVPSDQIPEDGPLHAFVVVGKLKPTP